MQKKRTINYGAAALTATLALFTGTALASTHPHARMSKLPKVTITVQGRTTTLLKTRTVQGRPGYIRRGGAGPGMCPADSAQGALNVATHGHWQGKWYQSYHEYYITSILGLSETGKKYYWGFYVNGKLSSKGACDVRLRAGERLLFKVTRA